jgi:RNA polymerase sigma-70 factor, ECF subfamily
VSVVPVTVGPWSITTGDLDTVAEADVLDAARRGDSAAFETLIVPHRRALHVHCYRMLGSYTDAEDAMQEALLLAWRGLSGYEGRAPLRHWLYRITTTTCLKMINRRGREPVTTDDVAWLQPYPNVLLDQLVDADADPAAVIGRRASVTLAFVAAMQLLPATQRAVLILRDVLCWSSREVAELLDTSIAAVNSALQRALATVAATPNTSAQTTPLGDQERRVVEAFVRAWAQCDMAALAALLREDAILTMPPQSIRIVGRDQITQFFGTVPAEGRLDLIRLVITRANGHPALAAYLPGEGLECQGYGIMVITVVGETIASITGFPSPDLFPAFGLPTTIEEYTSQRS